jgi:hypothetical protein
MTVKPILAVAALAAILAPVAAGAQETSSPVTPLRIQVTISRFEGEKKVATLPYSLMVNAGDRENRVALRMGVAVPITTMGKDGPTVTVHDIGTNMDCSATPADGGRFRVNLAVNYSAVYESDPRHLQAVAQTGAAKPGETTPLVRSFTSSFSLLLRNGETGQSIAATDPVTGEVMRIDVSLTVLK